MDVASSMAQMNGLKYSLVNGKQHLAFGFRGSHWLIMDVLHCT